GQNRPGKAMAGTASRSASPVQEVAVAPKAFPQRGRKPVGSVQVSKQPSLHDCDSRDPSAKSPRFFLVAAASVSLMLLFVVAGVATAGFLWMQGNANKNRNTDQTLAQADSSNPDPSTKQPETNSAPTKVSKGSTNPKADAKPVEAQPETKQGTQVVKAPEP